MNPYSVLGVHEDVDDEGVRAAYLKLVHQFSPEHSPDKFQIINHAYEKINTVRKRYTYKLFNTIPECESPMGVLESSCVIPCYRKPLPLEAMKEFLRQCARM